MDITNGTTAPDQLRSWLKAEGRASYWFAAQMGVDPATVSQWLNGHRPPHRGFRHQIEQITGVPADAWSDPIIKGNPQ